MSPSRRDSRSLLAVVLFATLATVVMMRVSPTQTAWLGYTLYFALFLALFSFGLREEYRCSTLLRRLVAR